MLLFSLVNLKVGDTIKIKGTFDEVVSVDSKEPTLTLDSGETRLITGQGVNLSYTTVFEYTVLVPIAKDASNNTNNLTVTGAIIQNLKTEQLMVGKVLLLHRIMKKGSHNLLLLLMPNVLILQICQYQHLFPQVQTHIKVVIQ